VECLGINSLKDIGSLHFWKLAMVYYKLQYGEKMLESIFYITFLILNYIKPAKSTIAIIKILILNFKSHSNGRIVNFGWNLLECTWNLMLS